MAFYIKKEPFLQALSESHKADKLTKQTIEYFMQIANGLSKKLKYKYEDDRFDCIQEGLFVAVRNWRKYNMNHPKANPFSYFTEIIKNGMGLGFKKLRGNKQKRVVTMSFNDETLNF